MDSSWYVSGCLRCSLSNLCKCWAPSVQQQTKIAQLATNTLSQVKQLLLWNAENELTPSETDLTSAPQSKFRLVDVFACTVERKNKWRVCVWKTLPIQSALRIFFAWIICLVTLKCVFGLKIFSQRRRESELSAAIFAFPLETTQRPFLVSQQCRPSVLWRVFRTIWWLSVSFFFWSFFFFFYLAWHKFPKGFYFWLLQR